MAMDGDTRIVTIVGGERDPQTIASLLYAAVGADEHDAHDDAAIERAVARVGIERVVLRDVEAEERFPVVTTYATFGAYLLAEG